jgi:protoporphyrinogen oxidase
LSGRREVVIVGAGAAGLTAAYELVQRGIRPVVLERGSEVGGLARTVTYKGYRFDIGGHRFYTRIKEADDLWRTMLGDSFLRVARLSRISYGGRFYRYPLELANTLFNLGPIESGLILLSYIGARLRPYPQEETFEQWVVNRFGRRLYETFFEAYTEKVWGIPCSQIRADWAAQRIRGLSLRAVLSNVLFGSNHAKTLISEFHYPALGPGMMWQRFQERVEAQGGQIWLDTEVVRLERQGRHITGLVARRNGRSERIEGDHYISSMSLGDLIGRLDPPAPEEIVQAASRLCHRDFILVGLIVNRAELFPDNWIYVHNPEVRVGRIQNFKNWSAAMVPDLTKTSLGLEYFCTAGDATWRLDDAQLIELAIQEMASLGLGSAADVEDGMVIRQPRAYPVYDEAYRSHLDVLRHFLEGMENLQTIGRNGLHRYNNMDHSMLTAIRAASNVLGASYDLWELGEGQEYLEGMSR